MNKCRQYTLNFVVLYEFTGLFERRLVICVLSSKECSHLFTGEKGAVWSVSRRLRKVPTARHAFLPRRPPEKSSNMKFLKTDSSASCFSLRSTTRSHEKS